MTKQIHSIEELTKPLSRGAHDNFDDGYCAMEAVAWLAGEDHTDHPDCACPVIGAYVRKLNDRMPGEERAKLVPLLPKLIGSVREVEVERKRAFKFVDTAVRVFAKVETDEIVNRETAIKGRDAAYAMCHTATYATAAADAVTCYAAAAAADAAADAAVEAAYTTAAANGEAFYAATYDPADAAWSKAIALIYEVLAIQ